LNRRNKILLFQTVLIIILLAVFFFGIIIYNLNYLNLILLIFMNVIIGLGIFKYNRRSQEVLRSEISLQEKEKYLKELETLNGELKSQKDAYASLWEETAVLNTELYEKNKNISEQKQSIEALWEESNALNEELIQKNSELSTLNNKIQLEKEKLIMINGIGEHMISSSDLDVALVNIVNVTRKILDFQTVRILKYNPSDKSLELLTSIGYQRDVSNKLKIPLQKGISGYAAQNREIVLVNDVAKDERYICELNATKAELAIPLLVKDELLGVLDLQNNQPFIYKSEADQLLLKVLGSNIAMVLKNHQLSEQARQYFLDIVEALIAAIEVKDSYTSGHCERVKEIALEIGKLMELDKQDLEILELAALLHDIGKIGLPEGILNKKGKLTKEEYELVKKHPLIGYAMLDGISSLQRINKIILQHHERVDGQGYPNKLNGNDIDILARILAVADAIDAMTSVRPYRAIQSKGYVLEQLEMCSGTQFDQKIAAIAKIIVLKSIHEDKCKINNSDVS